MSQKQAKNIQNNLKWGRIILLIGLAIIVSIVILYDSMLDSISGYFQIIAKFPKLYYLILGLSVLIAILHLFFVPKGGIAKEHLLYKRLGPILSTPLTCLTFGTFIYCGIMIIYIICYDDNTMMKYSKVDKGTLTLTMIALMTYSVYGLGLIVSDICNPKEEIEGNIIKKK